MPSKPGSKPAKSNGVTIVNAGRPFPTFDPAPSGRLADDALRETGVAGVLIGRLAVWAWVTDPSQQAFTKDLDMGVAPADLPKLRAWATKKGLKVQELLIGGFNASDKASGVNVDFIDRSNPEWGDLSALFRAAIAASKREQLQVEVGGRCLPVVSAPMLLIMKLAAARPTDDDDVCRLLLLPTTDVDQVRKLTAKYAPLLMGRLETMLQSVGHPKAKKRYKLS